MPTFDGDPLVVEAVQVGDDDALPVGVVGEAAELRERLLRRAGLALDARQQVAWRADGVAVQHAREPRTPAIPRKSRRFKAISRKNLRLFLATKKRKQHRQTANREIFTRLTRYLRVLTHRRRVIMHANISIDNKLTVTNSRLFKALNSENQIQAQSRFSRPRMNPALGTQHRAQGGPNKGRMGHNAHGVYLLKSMRKLP